MADSLTAMARERKRFIPHCANVLNRMSSKSPKNPTKKTTKKAAESPAPKASASQSPKTAPKASAPKEAALPTKKEIGEHHIVNMMQVRSNSG
jgi:hypothetical protein